jgi:hypothetical protein
MKQKRPEIITLTPTLAAELLEHNTLNRPLSQPHVERIAKQILDGKWRFNGDTIKVAETGDVLDGQHRLWAVIEAKKPVDTILVRNIEREAFATIDTLRKPRSGSDVLALNGATHYRATAAAALQWLVRWQRNAIEDYKAPQFRVENSDIEAAYAAHPGIIRAVERAHQVRNVGNPSIIGFFYYVLTNRNPDLAERMMTTLENPAGVAVTDPFFRLRAYFLSDHHKRKEPIVSIANMIKATNAAHRGQKIQVLNWKHQGEKREMFPDLSVK